LLPDFNDRPTGRRFAVEGEVVLNFDDTVPREIRGQFLDFGRDGFRVIHSYVGLVSGQSVYYHHVLAKGAAKVVWNRIIGEMVETGFIIIGE